MGSQVDFAALDAIPPTPGSELMAALTFAENGAQNYSLEGFLDVARFVQLLDAQGFEIKPKEND